MTPEERRRLGEVEAARDERARRPQAAPTRAPRAPRTPAAVAEGAPDRFSGIRAAAVRAAADGQSEADCPYTQGRGGFQGAWLEAFRAAKSAEVPAGKGKRAAGA